jgi:hypothetical protein
MDRFTEAYIEAALWSSVDDSGNPLDSQYSSDDLAPETLAKMVDDCTRFQDDHAALITDDKQAGHDFWLTRNHHGAGFWDGDWPEPSASTLTAASHAFGSFDLYVGDDGLLYA